MEKLEFLGDGWKLGRRSRPYVDEVEALRARILREAEVNFEKEMRRLAAGRESGDATSFKTASSGTQGVPAGDQHLHGLPQQPPGLPHAQGVATGPTSRIGEGMAIASTTEALRNLELPPCLHPMLRVHRSSLEIGLLWHVL